MRVPPGPPRIGSDRTRSPLSNRHRLWRAYMLTVSIVGGLLAAAACGSSTAPKPKIAFAPTSITLSAVAGGTASGAVSVKNAGGSTLSGLAAAVGAYSTGASGWLSASLATANAPTALNLAVNAANLAAGTYSAVVNVSAAAASPPTATLTVTLTVTQ